MFLDKGGIALLHKSGCIRWVKNGQDIDYFDNLLIFLRKYGIIYNGIVSLKMKFKTLIVKEGRLWRDYLLNYL